jgi:hypothetical protein
VEPLFAQNPVVVAPGGFGFLHVLNVLIGVGSLVCFVLVLVQMFQRGRTGLGIASVVLLPCCGLGALIAFVVGWMHAAPWGIRNVMIAWTAFVVINGVLYALAPIPVATVFVVPAAGP